VEDVQWLVMPHNLIFMGIHFVIGKREYWIIVSLRLDIPSLTVGSLRELAFDGVSSPPIISVTPSDEHIHQAEHTQIDSPTVHGKEHAGQCHPRGITRKRCHET
jgi:hypothetical protein